MTTHHRQNAVRQHLTITALICLWFGAIVALIGCSSNSSAARSSQA